MRYILIEHRVRQSRLRAGGEMMGERARVLVNGQHGLEGNRNPYLIREMIIKEDEKM